MEACRRHTSADLYMGTAFLPDNLHCSSSPFAMDGYNFFDYFPRSDNEEGENDVVQVFSTMLWKIFKFLIMNGRKIQNIQ